MQFLCLAVMVLTFPQFCQTLEKGELQLDELQSRYLGHRSKRHTRNFKDPQTVIGEYNGHDKCWVSGPDNADLPVCDKCQSASIRFKIGYLLLKNPFVEYVIKSTFRHCDQRKNFASIGLQSSCPSEISFPTGVNIFGKRCYVVQPEKQCVTYVKCTEKSPCHNGIETGTEMSKCLQDNFRTFDVWVYCTNFGFRRIQLKLPQCCTCKRFSLCVSTTTPVGPTVPQN